MKLNPKKSLGDRWQARIAATAIVTHGFDMERAVAELRPDIKSWEWFGGKMLREPAVLYEIGAIMDRKENNANRFVKKMWEWLDDETEGKEQNERRQTAARILAKGYVSEKKGEVVSEKPYVVDGLEQGMENLVGPNVVPEKKVVQ